MTLRNRGEPSGFANLAGPLMAAQMRKSTSRDLQLLKSILEKRLDQQTLELGGEAQPVAMHVNVRGAGYFAEKGEMH